MMARTHKGGAAVLRHPAIIFRAWTFEKEGPDLYRAVLRSVHGVEARTVADTEWRVRDAVRNRRIYRGAPIAVALGDQTDIPF